MILCVQILFLSLLFGFTFLNWRGQNLAQSPCYYAEELVSPNQEDYSTFIVVNADGAFFSPSVVENIQKTLRHELFLNNGGVTAFNCHSRQSIMDINVNRTLVIIASNQIQTIDIIRVTIGSLHKNYPGIDILFVTPHRNQISDEVMLFSNTKVIEMNHAAASLFKTTDALKNQHEQQNLFPVGPLNSSSYLEGQCALSFFENYQQYIPPSVKPKERICLSIFLQNNQNNVPMSNLYVFSYLLPSFLQSTVNSTFDWSFYVGFQFDDYFNNKETDFERIFNEITASAQRSDIQLRLLFVPLEKETIYTTFKYNYLHQQAYRDGCDYLYQTIDDIRFLTRGWDNDLVNCLKSQKNYGAAVIQHIYPLQQINKEISYAMVSRRHMDIFGEFWPRQLRNWGMDKWFSQLYQDKFCAPPQHFTRTTNGEMNTTLLCKNEDVFETTLVSHKEILSKIIENDVFLNQTVF